MGAGAGAGQRQRGVTAVNLRSGERIDSSSVTISNAILDVLGHVNLLHDVNVGRGLSVKVMYVLLRKTLAVIMSCEAAVITKGPREAVFIGCVSSLDTKAPLSLGLRSIWQCNSQRCVNLYTKQRKSSALKVSHKSECVFSVSI